MGRLWQWLDEDGASGEHREIAERPGFKVVQSPANPPHLEAVRHDANAPDRGRPVEGDALVGAYEHPHRMQQSRDRQAQDDGDGDKYVFELSHRRRITYSCYTQSSQILHILRWLK